MNNRSGFAYILIILFATVIVIGGGMYVYYFKSSHTTSNYSMSSSTPSTPLSNSPITPNKNTPDNENTNSAVHGWKIYKNFQHGYEIQYPSGIKVGLAGGGFNGIKWVSYSPQDIMSSTTAWYASTCVIFEDSNWYINISAESAFSQVACGSTGTSATNKSAQDVLTANGTQIETKGRIEPDRSSSAYNFNFNNRVYVEYGTRSTSLSEEDYKTILNSIHAILSTLKLVPSFVPSAPPNNGRG